jgi:DNA-binding LacI/PurR family transcriptional regulator
MKRPTLNTVAVQCGVSTSTVSRAFSRPEFVKTDVRERILAMAAELGYRPNKLARGLATGRLGRIGLLVPDVANPFFTELLRVVHHVASTTAQCSLLIVNTNETPSDEADLISGLLAEVDGVIIASPRSRATVLKQAIDDAPAVFINRPISGQDSVILDYGSAMEQAGEHLIRAGHRRIALLRGPSSAWAATQRANALIRWAARRGFDLVDLGRSEPSVDSGMAVVDSILRSNVTAVVAYDDISASGVIAGLHAKGLLVPDDISVVGCDDTLLARLLTPSITTVSPPYSQLGVEAMRALIQRIEAPEGPPSHTRLTCELVIRDSTRPPR